MGIPAHKMICLNLIDILELSNSKNIDYGFFEKYRKERKVSFSSVERAKRELIRQKILKKTVKGFLITIDDPKESKKLISGLNDSTKSIIKEAKEKLKKYDLLSRDLIEEEMAKYSVIHIDRLIEILIKDGFLKKITGDKSRGKFIIAKNVIQNVESVSPYKTIYTFSKDLVFCYHSALQLHGISRYGMSNVFYIHGKISRIRHSLKEISIRNIKLPAPQVGIMKLLWDNLELKVTDIERTIIDCVHKPSYAVGWENVLFAINKIDKLDENKVLNILKLIGKPILFAKIGIILEQYQDKWSISKNTLNSIKLYIQRTPVRFFRETPGRLSPKWNLYVPEDLFLS